GSPARRWDRGVGRRVSASTHRRYCVVSWGSPRRSCLSCAPETPSSGPSPRSAGAVVAIMTARRRSRATGAGVTFSLLELQVLAGLADGYTLSEIAQRLHFSQPAISKVLRSAEGHAALPL